MMEYERPNIISHKFENFQSGNDDLLNLELHRADSIRNDMFFEKIVDFNKF